MSESSLKPVQTTASTLDELRGDVLALRERPTFFEENLADKPQASDEVEALKDCIFQTASEAGDKARQEHDDILERGQSVVWVPEGFTSGTFEVGVVETMRRTKKLGKQALKPAIVTYVREVEIKDETGAVIDKKPRQDVKKFDDVIWDEKMARKADDRVKKGLWDEHHLRRGENSVAALSEDASVKV